MISKVRSLPGAHFLGEFLDLLSHPLVSNWDNPQWDVLNERKDLLKSPALHFVPEKIDFMDADYDEGRVKKVKQKKPKAQGGGHNPFQKVQDLKNQGKPLFQHGHSKTNGWGKKPFKHHASFDS